MRETDRITKEELLFKMVQYSDVYDMVRLVEPETASVVTFHESGVDRQQEPCFSAWDKSQRCENCAGLKACNEKRRISRLEFKNDEAFCVVVKPFRVVYGEKEYRLSLELVNRVEDDFVLESDGIDPQTQKAMEINKRLYQDSLTGAYNRRYYDEYLYIFDISHTLPQKIGYLVIDVNHFKSINDIYGHLHGDEVLAKIANVLKANTRAEDKVMRIGGDEFLIVMKGCSQQLLENKIHQIKKAVTKIKFAWLKSMGLSVAVGMSYTETFNGNQKELKQLFVEADARMYEDKKAPAEHFDTKAVLVVDDVEMNRTMVKAQLRDSYQVYEAQNGMEALKILNTNQIDLIVTDIFMEPVNGYELMSEVKAIPSFRDIPIIAVTENNESSQKKAIESGADIYIDRPIGTFLGGIVSKLTGRDHGRKELFDMDFLLDTIPGAVAVYKISEDGGMETVSCSRGVNQLLGWEAEDFCGAGTVRSAGAVYPDDLGKFTKTIQRMVRTHSRGEVIYRGFKKDGSVVWIWFQGRYIGEEEGCAVIEAILLDVSNNTNMYQNIMDLCTSAITVVDAHTFEVLYANKKADELVNKNKEAYIGSICYDFVFHRDKPCEHCIARKYRTEQYESEVEYGGRLYHQIFQKIKWHGIDAFLGCTTEKSSYCHISP